MTVDSGVSAIIALDKSTVREDVDNHADAHGTTQPLDPNLTTTPPPEFLMLTHLAVTHVGPIGTASLSLAPITSVTGASGTGKSSLIRVLAYTLGLGDPGGTIPADILLPGHTIRFDLSDGRALHMNSTGLLILAPAEALPGAPLPRRARLGTAKAILPALTAAGILPPVPPALLRLAYHPGEVLRLAAGTPAERRQLADTLAPVMGDPVSAFAQAFKAYGVADWAGPRTERDLEPTLKDQRSRVERLRGALGVYEAALASDPPADPGPAPSATLSALARRWTAYDTAAGAVTRWGSVEVPDAPDPKLLPGLRARYAVVKAALAEWGVHDRAAAKVAAWEAFPVPPAPDAEALWAAGTSYLTSLGVWSFATGALEQWDVDVVASRPTTEANATTQAAYDVALAVYESTCAQLVAASTCEECGHVANITLPDAPVMGALLPVMDLGPQPPAPGLRPERSPEHQAMLDAEEAYRNAVRARGPKPADPVAPLTPRPVDTLDAITAQAATANAAQAAHDAAVKARGACPPAPIVPAEPRPTVQAIAAEAAAIDVHRTALAIYETSMAARDRAEADLARTRTELAAAEEAVATTTRAREAIRAVPGILAAAADWRTAIADTITIHADGFSIKGFPNGSTGWRIYADATFRAALLSHLRKLGPHALPLVVDDRLSWSGNLPIYDGQTIAISTVAGPLSALSSA